MTDTAHYDVAIVGGAVIGSAVASFLSSNPDFDGRIVVIEQDRSYQFAASSRSTSGYRQQFSTAVNIQLSKWSAQFLTESGPRLAVDGDTPDIGLHERGYLYLGGPEHVAAFEANNRLQRTFGVDAALLSPTELKRRFPWLSVDDVAIGSLGQSGEGWFDGYSLMTALARKARAGGATYRYAAVTGVKAECGFGLTLDPGDDVTADRLVLCAGIANPVLAAMLGVSLPVRRVKQIVFPFESPFTAPEMPYVFTPDGLFCRPEGREFISGIGIDNDSAEVAADDFDVDHAMFENEVWPRLARRVQAFEQVRPKGGWAGHYDMSMFDHNPFIGAVEAVPNLYIASGFSGHGIMQSPGVGCALSELIVYGEYRTIDLTDLSFARIAQKRPIIERIQY